MHCQFILGVPDYMANIKSAKKRIEITKRNRLRNVSIHSRMKTAIKTYYLSVEKKSPELLSVLRETLKIVDKTASKKVIKKQKASRLKSRIMKHFNTNSKDITFSTDPDKKDSKKTVKKASSSKVTKKVPVEKKVAKKPSTKTTAKKVVADKAKKTTAVKKDSK